MSCFDIPRKRKICFITANAYPLLSEKPTSRVIGPDIYTIILAKAMKDRGYQVSVITYWDEDPQIEVIDGITVFKLVSRHNKNYFFDKLSKLINIWKYIRVANADYYFHAGGMDGACVLLSRIMRKQYVYSIGSDAQLNRQLVSINNDDFSTSRLDLGTLGCAVDVTLANTIVVQSEYQKRLLKEKYNRTGTLIKMPFPITKKETFEKASPPTIIWVGSLAEVKQPELFVQIAEKIPEATFLMIGGGREGHEIPDYIKEKEVELPNFRYLGVVPFSQIDTFFERATALVNTSLFEGFPNAFIQSWMHQTPVVSLNADPDEIICNLKMGFHSRSVEQMVKDIRELLQNQDLCRTMGQNGRRYVEKYHDIDAIVQDYEGVFL
jgi:glycosyltransferase involved in cell wall biosynthesis